MRICKRNHVGKKANTCAPRKRTTPTKIEARLQKRIESFNMTVRALRLTDPKKEGYTRPGSLKK